MANKMSNFEKRIRSARFSKLNQIHSDRSSLGFLKTGSVREGSNSQLEWRFALNLGRKWSLQSFNYLEWQI